MTCAPAGATATLYPGYYLMTVSNGDLAVSAAGSITGGAQGKADTLGFAYSGRAARVKTP